MIIRGNAWSDDDPDAKPPAPLYDYTDGTNTFQCTRADGDRAGLARVGDDPVPAATPRPRVRIRVDGPAARQVGDASLGEGLPATADDASAPPAPAPPATRPARARRAGR